MDAFRRRWPRRRFLQRGPAGMLAAAAGAAAAEPAAEPAPGMVVLGQVGLSFYAVVGALVEAVLRRLGHRVQLRTGPHEQMFPLLADGALDLMVAAWLPEGHGEYWARYGAQAMPVARLYGGARFFWAVPSYVPADAVGAIGDLARPEVAARMRRTIQAIGTGASITRLSQQALARYGLERAGYMLRPGSSAEWIAALEAARAARQWVVFPTWAPQYLNRGGILRPLEDPLGVLGGENEAVMVAPRARFERLPARTRRVLKRIALDLEAVTAMDHAVNVDGLAPAQAAQAWLDAHPDVAEAWLRA